MERLVYLLATIQARRLGEARRLAGHSHEKALFSKRNSASILQADVRMEGGGTWHKCLFGI